MLVFSTDCKQLFVHPQPRGAGRWWVGELSVLLALSGAGGRDTGWAPEWVAHALILLCPTQRTWPSPWTLGRPAGSGHGHQGAASLL